MINYEISRTTRTEVQAAGRLKRLSVAVLVDGVYARGPNGETTYQPRGGEDLDRIAALVRTAVGYDKARGDQVEVVNLPFAETPPAVEPDRTSLFSSLLSPTKDDVLRWAELGVTALLTLLVLGVVVRPMVKRIIAPEGATPAGVPAIAAAAAPGGSQALLGAGSAAAGADGHPPAITDGTGAGSTASEQIARLGDLARGNPKQAAAVLRGWMVES
jgi:flagellar M-ring protein FliF